LSAFGQERTSPGIGAEWFVMTRSRLLAGHRLAGHRYYNAYEPMMQIKVLEDF